MPCHFLTRAGEALGRIIQQLCLGRVGYEGEVMATALYNGNCYFGTLLMANVFRMDNSQFTYMDNLGDDDQIGIHHKIGHTLNSELLDFCLYNHALQEETFQNLAIRISNSCH